MQADQPQRQKITIDGRRFSNMAGFYDEVERVLTFGLDRKIGRNLNAFNDILRGGFGRHEYGQPIHIQWLAYEKSVRNLGKETMDTIVEIILDTDHSGHDCSGLQGIPHHYPHQGDDDQSGPQPFRPGVCRPDAASKQDFGEYAGGGH